MLLGQMGRWRRGRDLHAASWDTGAGSAVVFSWSGAGPESRGQAGGAKVSLDQERAAGLDRVSPTVSKYIVRG
jgi:hypothetical protein